MRASTEKSEPPSKNSIVSRLSFREKVERMARLAKGRKRALILTHDNPDPDSMASASALAFLLEQRMKLEARVGYGGIIGRAENIAGVKDATANLARVSQQRHAMGPDFVQLSGEDMTALAYMAAGGHGCISVVANVAPKLCANLMSAVLKGDYVEGLKIQDRLVPLHDAIFKEPGLAGAKHGLKLLGRIAEDVRLPLVPVTPPTGKTIHEAMVYAGLLN